MAQDGARRCSTPRSRANIAMVGKYVDLADSYKSLHEAIAHGGIANDARSRSTTSTRRNSRRATSTARWRSRRRSSCPAASATRGTEGKIRAVRCARENEIPILGICFGLQMMVIEFARHVLGLEARQLARVRRGHARSGDRHDGRAAGRDPQGRHHAAGRLSVRAARGTRWPHRLYGKPKINERHRHRYEVNNAYRQRAGERRAHRHRHLARQPTWWKSWRSKGHPWFLGCQFHPELRRGRWIAIRCFAA